MTDHDTAAAILAELTRWPVTDPIVQLLAAIHSPRLATTDPNTFRAHLIGEASDLVQAVASRAHEIALAAEAQAA